MYVSVRCCPIEMHFLKIDYFTFCLFLRQPYHENGWYVFSNVQVVLNLRT